MTPGILAAQTRGRAHQISRARASTASAPPYCVPFCKRKRNSRRSSCRDIPSSAPTRGSWSGATAKPRRARMGASHRAMRLQKLQSASKKSQPFAWRPFPSVYSLANEIMASSFSAAACAALLGSANLFLFTSKQRNHFAAQLPYALQGAGWHAQNFLKESGHRGQELQHALEALSGIGILWRVGLEFVHAFAEDAQGRVDLPAFSFLGDRPENFPDVLERLEVVAAVSENVHNAHDAPAL